MEKADAIFKKETSWKHLIIGLYHISNKPDNPFSENASYGFYYLMGIVFNAICGTCDDAVMKWLYDFKDAWLLRKELPLFRGCTCGNEE